ncbi:Six-hairpin glycosidase [Mollisia scopiformis]|uniref:Six-hairpin glycosidase n=1 Tax=Mollisia scopiformis TaxID=149040 RepID=A0A132B7C0_MOLSC|nr:Six-hairpin glycosidase [Mollisia scopiformis]KUJ08308.1 Six-hairpin glycosidase [Mollisia scopiformis]
MFKTVAGVPDHYDASRSCSQCHGTRRSLLRRDLENTTSSFPAMVNALEVMQSLFWDPSNSTWPTGIDWTMATFNTDISTTLATMATYEDSTYASDIQEYFSEVVAFYSGEDAIGLTTQKFDDEQWVILEWLEAIKFVNLYSSIDPSFDGQQYIPEFAHRARVFWDLASQGYNTTLCGGGMVWTYSLAPYKNAITNQLFVASSIGMYLYFPGDSNPNPSPDPDTPYNSSQALPPIQARDQRYLNAAITEYDWLSTSNMTNAQGLYVDGFHITGYVNTTDIGTGNCDSRDESVYTYNQGVLLSGLRGLWDATGDQKYVTDGYTLMNSVINATGWPDVSNNTWAGLGSNGILQDLCDVDGSCSQDAQNFKGIFFHHLTLFCQPLAMDEAQQKSQNTSIIFNATPAQAQAHQAQCDTYTPWILHNSQAAYATRNSSGVYGGWWDANYTVPEGYTDTVPGAADVMNKGIPQNRIWRLPNNPPVATSGLTPVATTVATDPNDRGRGRTVETQSGGLGVMTSLVNAEES